MVIAQLLRPNNSMHVGLHKLLNQIHFFEGLERFWLEDVQYTDDILVLEMPEELDLAERS